MSTVYFARGWNAACCAIANMIRDDAKRAESRATKNARRNASMLRAAQHRAEMARLDLPASRRLKLAVRFEERMAQPERDTAAKAKR